MDLEYLQNIAVSSHIDEGLGDRILARGASGMQRFGAMTGGELQDLNYKKVNTLFGVFVNRLKGILKDFAEGPHSVANRLEQMRPVITPQQKQKIDQLRALHDLITPPRIQQHQLAQNIKTTRSPRTMTEVLKEGIFSRAMGLNQALQTNDPTIIINAYVNEIKKNYDTFIRDAMKTTGTPKDFVRRVVGNLNPKWSSVLTNVDGIVNEQPSPVQQPPKPTGGEAIPPPTGTTPEEPAVGGSSEEPPTPQQTPKANSSEEDFVAIAIQVADAIVSAVKGDVERSAPFFKPKVGGKEGELESPPQDWDAPSVTKEAAVGTNDDTDNPTTTSKEEDVPEGEANEFLYNFHSLYRKQRHFAIRVPSKELWFTNRVKNQLNTFEVVWSNNSHENNIYVKYTPVKKTEKGGEAVGKSGNVIIFKFTDDQVNPRNPQSNQFNIPTVMEQANKTAGQILKKVSKTNPALIKALNERTGMLQRALYATTSRKRMEFKPKKAVHLQLKDDGNVFYKDKIIPKNEINTRLFSSNIIEAKNWLESLDSIDYFKANPDMMGARNKAEAILKLVEDDILHNDAIRAVADATKNMADVGEAPVSSIVTLAKQHYLSTKGKGVATTTSYKPTSPETTTVSKSPSAPPEKISGGASAPASTDKPEPEKAQSKTKIEVSDDGNVTAVDPSSGEVKTWKYPHAIPSAIIKQIENNPELKKKREDAIKKRQAAKAAKLAKLKGSTNSLTEELINPFDPSNFL